MGGRESDMMQRGEGGGEGEKARIGRKKEEECGKGKDKKRRGNRRQIK